MDISKKHHFEDDWLANALVYYQIIEQDLFDELSQRFADSNYFFDVMVKNNYLLPDDIVDFVESALKIPSVNLDNVNIDLDSIKLIPEEFCRKNKLIPFQVTAKEISIASFNPTNLTIENEIEQLTGKYVKTFFAFRNQIEDKINLNYTPDKVIDSLVGHAGQHSPVRIPGEDTVSNPSSVVRLVSQILADAVDAGASDIHVEPKETTAHVRIRIDGVLRNLLEIPKAIHPSLMSRIKIISNLNIAETRKPQDGKAKIYVSDSDIDLRVSILPTSFGEKAVIRILDKRKAAVSFDQMGIRGKNRERLEECFAFKQGMVLVTGPTGSGKSTTLYAAINRIKSTANNILTIEDPVEYVMDGINQVQVNEKAGVTFASALRSFLRQDPDVILVGEIRDRETAEIAVQAAQTGHLVLSTLHTNDTLATISRLNDMGVDKFKITESVQAIIAQRLVRRLCPKCKTRLDDTNVDDKLKYLASQINNEPAFFEVKGCSECGYTGYKGRIGVYEILVLDDNLRDKINTNAPLQEIRRIAKDSGFRNLFEDAISLIADGITDYEEILRTINSAADDNWKSDVQGRKLVEAAEHELPVKPEDNNSIGRVKSVKQIETEKIEEDESIKVLIVEDYQISRKMVCKMVQKYTKWQTQEAEDGINALEKIVDDKPDVILLDIMMPRMDGYELLQHLRAVPDTTTIPVILLTGLKTSENEEKGFKLGADDYLTKPIKPEILITRIKNALAKRKEFKPSYNSVEETQAIQGDEAEVQEDSDLLRLI